MNPEFIEHFGPDSPYNTENMYKRSGGYWLDAIEMAEKYNQISHNTITLLNDQGVTLVFDRYSGDATFTLANGEIRQSHMERLDDDLIAWDHNDLYADGWQVKPAHEIINLQDHRKGN